MHCEKARETPAVGIADETSILDVYALTPAATDASTGTAAASISIAVITAHAVIFIIDLFIVSSGKVRIVTVFFKFVTNMLRMITM
jgi:hypothetical protein